MMYPALRALSYRYLYQLSSADSAVCKQLGSLENLKLEKLRFVQRTFKFLHSAGSVYALRPSLEKPKFWRRPYSKRLFVHFPLFPKLPTSHRVPVLGSRVRVTYLLHSCTCLSSSMTIRTCSNIEHSTPT